MDIFKDINTSPSMYSKDRILVHSTFLTFQGEEPFSGKLAYFIRLSGCNRGEKGALCGVDCDTDFRMHKGTPYTAEALVEKLCEDTKHMAIAPMIIITGGEPMLQFEALTPFLNEVARRGWPVQFESNGDIGITDPSTWFSRGEGRFLVISPKAHRTAGYKKPVWHHHNIWAFRCVVTSDEDNKQHRIPDYIFDRGYKDVALYLSPMTVYMPFAKEFYERDARGARAYAAGWDTAIINVSATRRNYAYAAKYAMQLNEEGRSCSLSCQSHLFFGVE